MNKIELLGRLTKDPEIRYTQNNTPVASISLAVNRRFAKEGEQQADFINIVAWNKTAEFCGKYFKKGSQIALVGRLQTRSYENNGTKKYVTEVIAEEVYFADTKKDIIEDNGEPTDITSEVIAGDSDLPF